MSWTMCCVAGKVRVEVQGAVKPSGVGEDSKGLRHGKGSTTVAMWIWGVAETGRRSIARRGRRRDMVTMARDWGNDR